MLYCSWIRSRTRTTWGWLTVTLRPRFLAFAAAAAAATFRARAANPAAFCVPVVPWAAMPAPVPFVPWKSAMTEVGIIQYGTYRRMTFPSSDRSATFRRRRPLLSHFPPASRACSFPMRLSSRKCFWKTCAPALPIVVTAPQYSHTTRAKPAPGFIGAPQELHLKSMGRGGGEAAAAGAAGAWAGYPGAGAWAWGTPGAAPWAGTTTPCRAPQRLQNTEPSAIFPPHWLQNRGKPPVQRRDGATDLLKNSGPSVIPSSLQCGNDASRLSTRRRGPHLAPRYPGS